MMSAIGAYAHGDRVELIHTSDPDTKLRSGDTGTVQRQVGNVVHIEWDGGSRLSMCLDAGDQIRLVAS